jgi:hypothetical protein
MSSRPRPPALARFDGSAGSGRTDGSKPKAHLSPRRVRPCKGALAGAVPTSWAITWAVLGGHCRNGSGESQPLPENAASRWPAWPIGTVSYPRIEPRAQRPRRSRMHAFSERRLLLGGWMLCKKPSQSAKAKGAVSPQGGRAPAGLDSLDSFLQNTWPSRTARVGCRCRSHPKDCRSRAGAGCCVKNRPNWPRHRPGAGPFWTVWTVFYNNTWPPRAKNRFGDGAIVPGRRPAARGPDFFVNNRPNCPKRVADACFLIGRVGPAVSRKNRPSRPAALITWRGAGGPAPADLGRRSKNRPAESPSTHRWPAHP